MLVYANHFILNPEGGPETIIREIARWVGDNRKTYVDPNQLSRGVREFRLKDGATLSTVVTQDQNGSNVYPYYFCARFMHPDPHVSGRRWITEIGMRQLGFDGQIHCSVRLQTEEISARVNAPITVTCPGIVRNLIENCSPVDHTPSRSIVQLTEHNARAFIYEIERQDRDYPLILVSQKANGVALVNCEKLRRIMTGLAQVIDIPKNADTFAIEAEIGRKYSAFGGAVNIIFPGQKSDTGSFYRNVRLNHDHIIELQNEGGTIESEILSIVSHHTNVPNSWKHISIEIVRQEILRVRLQAAAAAAHDSVDLQVYEELLAEAGEQLDKKDSELAELRDDLDLAEANFAKASAEVEALKHALDGATSNTDFDIKAIASSITPIRELFEAAWSKQISLEQVLQLISTIYPERVTVLPSAYSSARESDRAGFSEGEKALELLMRLGTQYWDCLVEGKGDQNARSIFGKNGFAAKEAESLSAAGRGRRTFTYRGADVFMERHLKLGVKDSAAETLRVHFEWFADRQELVVGHCGKHLNF